MSKADYVRTQKQTRSHECHWPGCGAQVPPAMWGCKKHWFSLPANLRGLIWRTYRPGQEITMDPSDAYLAAAKEVQHWIAQNGNRPRRPPKRTAARKAAEAELTEWQDRVDDLKAQLRQAERRCERMQKLDATTIDAMRTELPDYKGRTTQADFHLIRRLHRRMLATLAAAEETPT